MPARSSPLRCQSQRRVTELIRCGAQISCGQAGDLLNKQTDLVVRSAAIKSDNSEYAAAVELGLRQVKYAELLGMVMADSSASPSRERTAKAPLPP